MAHEFVVTSGGTGVIVDGVHDMAILHVQSKEWFLRVSGTSVFTGTFGECTDEANRRIQETCTVCQETS